MWVCRPFLVGMPSVALVAGGGADDEELNSDDDEDDDDVERTIENLILCQYQKVARQKQKWKAQVRFLPPPIWNRATPLS